MENEIKRMQENMRVVKQEERRMHEEEVNGIKVEKQEIQKKLNTSEKKCKDLQMEVLNLKRKMEDEQRAHNKDMTELIKKQNGKVDNFIKSSIGLLVTKTQGWEKIGKHCLQEMLNSCRKFV